MSIFTIIIDTNLDFIFDICHFVFTNKRQRRIVILFLNILHFHTWHILSSCVDVLFIFSMLIAMETWEHGHTDLHGGDLVVASLNATFLLQQ
jgi:hypothetical protein